MIQRYIPKLKVGDLIEVHGFVMLSHLDPGTYRIKAITDHFGNDAYSFTRPKGKKVIRRHYVTNVDPWLRPANDPDLNKIVNLTQRGEA